MYNVLFIEDERVMVEALPAALEQYGLHVDATTSIEEGTSWFTDRSIDAVLLDIGMPPSANMDAQVVRFGRETGVEVARQLHGRKPRIPIIALTVVYDAAIKARVREAGTCEIINKPAEPSYIAETIIKAIKRADGLIK
jgi:DNA-binding response OmpR family regulator